MELKASVSQLQKTTIHYALLLSNHLVRFYKTLYSKSLFDNAPHISNEKSIAQDAIKSILSGDLNNFNFENSDQLEEGTESDSDDTPSYIGKNNANYCKLLQFLGVKSKSELIKIFNEFTNGSNKKSNQIVNDNEDLTTEESTSTTTRTDNTITTITPIPNDINNPSM